MRAPADSRGDGGGRNAEQLSFFPAPPFSPQIPKRATLTDVALKLFLSGQTLTHPEFQTITGSWRLAAYVDELKDLGWPFDKYDVASPSPSCRHRTITRYGLPRWVIDQCGEHHDA